MSFWSMSDGEDAKSNATGEFDAGGGKMELIPDGTSILAYIEEAKWDRNQDQDRYISLRWSVLAPEELKNRKVFQKLWVLDDDPQAKEPAKKRDKAKRMLAAIDTNAGGKLMARNEMPTDETLTSCLTQKQMVVRVMVWEKENRATGNIETGNWIGAVSPKSSPVSSAEEVAKKSEAAAARPPASKREIDDEIPF
jgi:hypothetical protein